MKDISKLVKKTVLGKDGKKHTVWVKANYNTHQMKGKKGQQDALKNVKSIQQAIAVRENQIKRYKDSMQGEKHFASEIEKLKGEIAKHKKDLDIAVKLHKQVTPKMY